MSDIVTISIACTSEDEARTIARHLVEQRLAACVQSHAVTSIYRWNGVIETAPEVMLTAKTLAMKLDVLAGEVRRLHSYDVPEILAQPVVWMSEDYAAWLRDAVD